MGNMSSAICDYTITVRFQDREHRSILTVTKTANERGIHIDVKYKKDSIYPRHTYYPNGTIKDVIIELSRKDKEFEIGDGGDYVVEALKDLLYMEEEETNVKSISDTDNIPIITYECGYKIGEPRRVESVNGFRIDSDKHAYICKKCGAVFQSKNLGTRSLVPTGDPRCISCDTNEHTKDDLKRVCECEPSGFATWVCSKEGVYVPTKLNDGL